MDAKAVFLTRISFYAWLANSSEIRLYSSAQTVCFTVYAHLNGRVNLPSWI
jgi:hypothetical protein